MLAHEAQAVVDARGQFLLVVSHHHQRLVQPVAEGVDDAPHEGAVRGRGP